MIESPDERRVVLEAVARYTHEAAAVARAVLDSPWTVAVVGRVGAGKTTAVNRLAGTERAVGLGGVTRAPQSIAHGPLVLVDTPGIDGLDTAITALGPVLAEADAILWVVDGLQPATRTERELLDAIAIPGTAIAAWVSRLDLVEPDQHEAILARVGRWIGEPPQGGDLRAWQGPLPSALAPSDRSARRTTAFERAVDRALEALDALPPLEGRLELERRLAGRWRQRVRAVVDRAQEELEAGQLAVTRRFQERFRKLAAEARDGFLSELGDEPALSEALVTGPPELPLPEIEPPDALGVVAAAMGGEHRARVQVREQGGHWLTESLLALAEWIEAADGIEDAARQRASDRALFERALAGET